MYQDLKKELNIFERVLFVLFKKYSIKVYKIGVKIGFNWSNFDTWQK